MKVLAMVANKLMPAGFLEDQLKEQIARFRKNLAAKALGPIESDMFNISSFTNSIEGARVAVKIGFAPDLPELLDLILAENAVEEHPALIQYTFTVIGNVSSYSQGAKNLVKVGAEVPLIKAIQKMIDTDPFGYAERKLRSPVVELTCHEHHCLQRLQED